MCCVVLAPPATGKNQVLIKLPDWRENSQSHDWAGFDWSEEVTISTELLGRGPGAGREKVDSKMRSSPKWLGRRIGQDETWQPAEDTWPATLSASDHQQAWSIKGLFWTPRSHFWSRLTSLKSLFYSCGKPVAEQNSLFFMKTHPRGFLRQSVPWKLIFSIWWMSKPRPPFEFERRPSQSLLRQKRLRVGIADELPGEGSVKNGSSRARGLWSHCLTFIIKSGERRMRGRHKVSFHKIKGGKNVHSNDPVARLQDSRQALCGLDSWQTKTARSPLEFYGGQSTWNGTEIWRIFLQQYFSRRAQVADISKELNQRYSNHRLWAYPGKMSSRPGPLPH